MKQALCPAERAEDEQFLGDSHHLPPGSLVHQCVWSPPSPFAVATWVLPVVSTASVISILHPGSRVFAGLSQPPLVS